MELDENGLYIAVFNCFVFNTNVAKPSFPLFSKLALFSTIFLSISTLKIYINDQTEISVCTLPINIDSKALVKEPAI